MGAANFYDDSRFGFLAPVAMKRPAPGTAGLSNWSERFTELPAARERQIRWAASSTYVIGAEGSPLVKIGHAKNPQRRLASLQTGQPMTLTLLWSQIGDYERALHQKFAAYRVRGEWFDLTPLGPAVDVVRNAVEAMAPIRGVTNSSA